MLTIYILVVLFPNMAFGVMATPNQVQSKWSAAINMTLHSHHISTELLIVITGTENHTEKATKGTESSEAGRFSSRNLPPNGTLGRKFQHKVKEEINMEQMIPELHYMAGGVMLFTVESFFNKIIVEDKHRTSSGRGTAPVVFLLQNEKQPLEVLQDVMAKLSLLESWSPRAPHLVVLRNSDDENEGTVAEVLGELWRHKVSRAAVLQNNPEGFLLSWWAPQGQGMDCQGPSTKGVAAMVLTAKVARRALPQRRPYNYFSGCTLKCSTFVWLPYAIEGDGGRIVDGLDFRILETIRKFMNFTTIYSVPHESYVEAGTNVSNGHAHFTMGAFSLLDVFYPAMDPTVTYWNEHIAWFVPIGLPIPRWLSVTRVFSGSLWLSVFVSCILVAGAFTILRIRYQPAGCRTPHAIDALRMLIGIYGQEPSNPFSSWIFALWLLSSLIINSAYQSGLIGFLANPGNYPSMSTVDELVERNMKILLHREYIVALEEYADPVFKILKPHWVPCEDLLVCIDEVASSPEYAMASEVAYITYGYKGEGRGKIKILGNIASYPILTLTEKGSPLLEWFDFYISGMVEGNLNGKWWNEMIGFEVPLGQQIISLSNPDPVKMSVEHLQGVFFILIFGLVGSLVVFIKEIVPLQRLRKYF